MNDTNNIENSPEYLKPDIAAAEERYDKWNSAMEDGVPEFAGEDVEQDQTPPENTDANTGYDEDLAKAAGTVRSLDAPAQKFGTGAVMEAIKYTDISTSSDPMGDIYQKLGVDTDVEKRELRDIKAASKDDVAEFQEQAGMPTTANRDASRTDAANRARYEINELKNLASKVESESPRFTELRERARVEGDNVYDVAVKDTSRRGMTDLFNTLKDQEEQAPEQPTEEVPNAEEGQLEAEHPADETVEAEEEPKSAEEEEPKAEQPVDEIVEAEEGQFVTGGGQLDTKQPEEASANKIVGADEKTPEKTGDLEV